MSVDVDKAVLDLLRAAFTGYSTERVHDGEVKGADWDEKAISAPLPYVLFFGGSEFPMSRRMVGSVARGNDVRMNCVGSTREQAAWTADKAYTALHGKRVAGRVLQMTDRSVPRRDDVWTRPDGGPLYLVSLSFDRR